MLRSTPMIEQILLHLFQPHQADLMSEFYCIWTGLAAYINIIVSVEIVCRMELRALTGIL